MNPNPFAWVSDALKFFPTREAYITNDVVIESRRIRLPHEDPADRFLVATALVHDAYFATVDRTLRTFKGLRVV